jgi:hypothetical protein
MCTTSTNQRALLEAVCALVPRIRVAAEQIDAQRELPQDLAEAIADASLLR